MKAPSFDFMAALGNGNFMFLVKEAPGWKVTTFRSFGTTTTKTCKTYSRMLRYVRRKTGCIPIIPTLEKKALLKESWNESDDEFLIFGQNGLGMSSN